MNIYFKELFDEFSCNSCRFIVVYIALWDNSRYDESRWQQCAEPLRTDRWPHCSHNGESDGNDRVILPRKANSNCAIVALIMQLRETVNCLCGVIAH